MKQYCESVSKATGVPIPPNYPVVGEDAFRTATGVHAAAVIKAYKKKDIELANAVYSGVPSQMFGLEQIIDIGPMSGKSNVLFWLERHGVAPADDVVERIYQRAKASDHTLTEPEILECVGDGTVVGRAAWSNQISRQSLVIESRLGNQRSNQARLSWL